MLEVDDLQATAKLWMIYSSSSMPKRALETYFLALFGNKI